METIRAYASHIISPYHRAGILSFLGHLSRPSKHVAATIYIESGNWRKKLLPERLPARTVRLIFLFEALMMALAGALAGLVLSQLCLFAAHRVYPSVPFATPAWAMFGSVVIALLTALIFSAVPASQAAAMAPVDALQDKKAE